MKYKIVCATRNHHMPFNYTDYLDNITRNVKNISYSFSSTLTGQCNQPIPSLKAAREIKTKWNFLNYEINTGKLKIYEKV